jgi:hypothetical protein
MKKKNCLRLDENAIPDGEGSSALPIAFIEENVIANERSERGNLAFESKMRLPRRPSASSQ